MPVDKKKILIAAAVAGLMAGSSVVAHAGSAFPGHDSQKGGCCQMKSCDTKSRKDAGSCKSSTATKADMHSCGGMNSCGGK